jgi:hypothetical protein
MSNNSKPKIKFAEVSWQVYEVRGVARQVGLELSEEEALRFLETYEVRLKAIMTSAAFDLMCDLFRQWETVKKKIAVR